MKRRVYTLGGEVRKYGKGGPMGLKLTGVLIQIFILWWVGKLASRLRTVVVLQKMNDRYVDGNNIAAEVTRPGLKYRDEQVVMDNTSIGKGEKMASDERTM